MTGLSWYEAAAYAAFAGKELPTMYHWYQADTANDIQLLPGLVLSTTNHDGKGPRRVDGVEHDQRLRRRRHGRQRARMGGKRERRHHARRAWAARGSDPATSICFPDPRSPFDRSAGNGMRGDEAPGRPTPARQAPTEHAPLPRRAGQSIGGSSKPVVRCGVHGLHAVLRAPRRAARGADRGD